MTKQTTKQRLRTVRRRGKAVLRRGKAGLSQGRAVIRKAVGPDDALSEQLQQAEARQLDDAAALRRQTSEVARLRKLIRQERKAQERWKQELKASRRSLMDPLPRLELPAGVSDIIDRARAEHLTYLGVPELGVLARQVHDADLAPREGLIIEAGTARGGSAIVMAAAKAAERPMKVYDVFGQIPSPTEADGGDVHARYEKILDGGAVGISGETYYGYRDDLYTEVTESFARLGVPVETHNVELIKGLFEDTIDLDQPVAFAHLDGDWYESTMTCLERIVPLLVDGGRIVLDDYFHWSGCRNAVDEYFANRPGYLLERRNKVHVLKL